MMMGVQLQIAVLFGLVLFSGGGAAETFVFQSEETVEGKITKATNNTIVITMENGAILPASLEDIVEIRVHTEDVGEVVGKLINWKDGVYEIDLSKFIVEVSDGRILSAVAPEIGHDDSNTDDPSKSVQPNVTWPEQWAVQNVTM